jgi:hypothetical protein
LQEGLLALKGQDRHTPTRLLGAEDPIRWASGLRGAVT